MGRLSQRARRTLPLIAGAARHRLLGEPKSKKIFVIGTGRSGTHWLGDILAGHPAIHVTVEKPPIFDWVTQMALRPDARPVLFPKLARRYAVEHAAVAPRHYADKSHPNIWIAEALADRFANAWFIGIRRNPFATVASMLQHAGVLGWIERWRDYPLPNRFLGIRKREISAYDTMPLAAKCALRWRSHAERLEELGPVLESRLLVLDYEDLQLRTDEQLERIRLFLGLATPIPRPHVKGRSLNRWRDELSEQQKREVSDIVGVRPG